MTESSDIHLSVVIPAYNEELRLPDTLSHAIAYLKTQPYRSEIIVVDDGSSDGTGQVVRRQRDAAPVCLELLRHPDGANHGKGASVKRGILAAQGKYRLFMDADNSTTLNQVERFWPFFHLGFDVVIGSRALRDSVVVLRQPKAKEIAGQFGNWLIRQLAVPGIFDTQAGFKIFRRDAAERIFQRVTIDKWGYDIELLVIARALGYRIREVPITWINAEGSKVTLKSYFEVLGEIRKMRRNLRAGLYK
ncbi:MAG: glycosyltransferase family 2 protein [Acidobacteria bacterium]|nr:glycosyltransferase family 2 protein [Acidobacteriota bacterium]